MCEKYAYFILSLKVWKNYEIKKQICVALYTRSFLQRLFTVSKKPISQQLCTTFSSSAADTYGAFDYQNPDLHS